jgi:hypothetical protein
VNAASVPTPTVPDPAAAATTAGRLPADLSIRVLAHLLTPVSCAVGLGVRCAGRVVSWRGHSCVTSGSLEDIAAQIAGLAQAGASAQDRWLALPGPSQPRPELGRLLKPLRSGAHVVLFGADLLGAPGTVAVDPALVAGEGGGARLAELCCLAVRGRLRTGPLTIGGVVVRCVGDQAALRVVPALGTADGNGAGRPIHSRIGLLADFGHRVRG